MLNVLAALLLFFFGCTSFGKQEPRSISSDNHIKVMNYHPHAVHSYTGFYGYQSSILFEPGETIQTLSMGDSKGWQISSQDNRLFIKPIDDMADTNATIITNKRVYYFELHAEEAEGIDDPRLAYEVRFLYSTLSGADDIGISSDGNVFEQTNSTIIPDVSDVDVAKKGLNFNYSISHVKGGHNLTAPARVFDDGKFTYLQFDDINADLPAVFFVDSKGYESLVNFRMSNDYMIVERVGSVFTLRNGSSAACLFNEAIPYKKGKSKKKK